MNIKVVYHSTTGNTKKLADAIANTLNVSADPIPKEPNATSVPIDLLFIGDGIYFGKPNKNTLSFIQQLNPQTVKNVAVFATYGGQAKIGADMKTHLNEKGLHVIGEPFTCKGQSWVFMNRNQPNEVDIQKIAGFAKSIVEKMVSEES